MASAGPAAFPWQPPTASTLPPPSASHCSSPSSVHVVMQGFDTSDRKSVRGRRASNTSCRQSATPSSPSDAIHASRSSTVSPQRSRSKKSLAPPPILTYHPVGGLGPGYFIGGSTYTLVASLRECELPAPPAGACAAAGSVAPAAQPPPLSKGGTGTHWYLMVGIPASAPFASTSVTSASKTVRRESRMEPTPERAAGVAATTAAGAGSVLFEAEEGARLARGKIMSGSETAAQEAAVLSATAASSVGGAMDTSPDAAASHAVYDPPARTTTPPR
mmetsp:Transcript_217/g.574  ORF Transcript_217/g.574 Transcript_217/m.574 type:complete len:275 (+) Transcript_217:102-926(+)